MIMKKWLYTTVIALGLVVFGTANAQVSVQVNIGSQPNWGPAGYDYARYYYIPAYNMYYDVPGKHYIYYDHGGWVRRARLPKRYRHYDFYRVHKVVINDRTPWHHHDRYRSRYGHAHGHQVSIRDSRPGHVGYSFAGERTSRRGPGWNAGKKHHDRGRDHGPRHRERGPAHRDHGHRHGPRR